MSFLYRLSPKLHTRLRDIVFGRTRITVIDKSAQSKLKVRPVFIIGCFRSGTTLLRYLLDSHSEISCPPESKFMVHLASLRRDSESMKAFSSMGFDEDYLRSRLQRFSNDFFLDYMIAKNKKRWVDKTPDYVRILDFVDWLYQGAADYIFIYRNGLDVAHSMFSQKITVLEPDKTLEKAFQYWLEDAETMLEWRKKLQGRCIDLFYEDLCRHPAEKMNAVFDFLNLPQEDVLDLWYRKHHDMGYEDIKARRQTSINMSHGNFDAWDKETVEDFKARAADVHSRIGYDPVTLLPV